MRTALRSTSTSSTTAWSPKRRDWSLDQIFDEAETNRAAFLEALQELDDEKIEQVVHFNGDNKRDPADIPFKLFLFGLARHDAIHVADMLKALPERANDPELAGLARRPGRQVVPERDVGPAEAR